MVNGMANREPVNLKEKAFVIYLKGLIFGCSLQYLGRVGSWSRGDAIVSLVARAHFCGAVIMLEEASVKMGFLSVDFYL
jgi:hypothetical protein